MEAQELLRHFSSDQSQEGMKDIRRIDVNHLIANKKNFYGLRNIKELAGMISVSHYVEPLIVTPSGESSEDYILIAGHRRLAAWKKLLEAGEVTDSTLPCIVREFKELDFEKADGSVISFSPEQTSFYYLILSNMGQRKDRTIQEQLDEIHAIEPLARAIYDGKRRERLDNNVPESFRHFFATQFLKMSSSALQRKLSLEKLTDTVRKAVEDGVISETAASQLVSLTPEEQDRYIVEVIGGSASGKVTEVAKETRRPENPISASAAPPFIVQDVEIKKDSYHDDLPDFPAPSETRSSAPSQDDSIVKPALQRHVPVPNLSKDERKAADDWWLQALQSVLKDAETQQAFYEGQGDTVNASLWGVRASFARYKIAVMEQKSKN